MGKPISQVLFRQAGLHHLSNRPTRPVAAQKVYLS